MSRSRSGKITCADCASTSHVGSWEFIRSVTSKGGTCECPLGCGCKVNAGERGYLFDTGQRYGKGAEMSEQNPGVGCLEDDPATGEMCRRPFGHEGEHRSEVSP